MPAVILLLIAAALAMPVDIVVHRSSSAAGTVTYQFLLRNHTPHELHNFMIGTMLSDSCPDLRELPIGWSDTTSCPGSILTPKPWRGCVNFQEECEGHFLMFEYPEDFNGLRPGDSLRFAVTVAKPDSTYVHASFWVNSNDRTYVGRVREEPKLAAPRNPRTRATRTLH